MRLAAIDIGSNSVHMIVADTFGAHSFKVIDRERERVKLGAGAFKTGNLRPDNMKAALEALQRCATLCRRLKVAKVIATATSAVREARNGQEFLATVKQKTGIEAALISGIDEARMIFDGVCHSTDLQGRRALVLDLGGGSLEVMVGGADKLQIAKSLPLGVQRLRDMFGSEDPLPRRTLQRLERHIDEHAGPLITRIRQRRIDLVVGTSGTHMTLGLCCLRLRGRDPWGSLNGYVIKTAELNDLAGQLLDATAGERSRLPGIDERRADTIHFGAAVLTRVLKHARVREFQLSGASLREGMLLQEMRSHECRPTRPPNVRISSAFELIVAAGADLDRAAHLAELAISIFDGTSRLHKLPQRARDLLETAALLDDIGRGLNIADREHLSYQLIRGGGLRGLTDREIELVGLTARYSRRGAPKERHRHFAEMDTDGQHIVRVLAGILRIAYGLDRGRAGVIRQVRCRTQGRLLRLFVRAKGNADLELLAAQQSTKLFAQTIGKDIDVKLGRNGD